MLHGWNDSVHQEFGSFIDLLCGERDKGGTAPPLSIPAAPRGNRCCALRSPPACLTAAGSTRHPVSVRLCPPSMASRPCHSRSGSPISAGVNTAAARPLVNAMKVSLWARFCRPDKAKPPSGNCAAAIMPDARNRLSSLGGSSGSIHVCRIRQSRHPAIVPW